MGQNVKNWWTWVKSIWHAWLFLIWWWIFWIKNYNDIEIRYYSLKKVRFSLRDFLWYRQCLNSSQCWSVECWFKPCRTILPQFCCYFLIVVLTPKVCSLHIRCEFPPRVWLSQALYRRPEVFEEMLPHSRAWPSTFVSPGLCGWGDFCSVLLFLVTIYAWASFLPFFPPPSLRFFPSFLLSFSPSLFLSFFSHLSHAKIRNQPTTQGRFACRFFYSLLWFLHSKHFASQVPSNLAALNPHHCLSSQGDSCFFAWVLLHCAVNCKMSLRKSLGECEICLMCFHSLKGYRSKSCLTWFLSKVFKQLFYIFCLAFRNFFWWEDLSETSHFVAVRTKTSKIIIWVHIYYPFFRDSPTVQN